MMHSYARGNDAGVHVQKKRLRRVCTTKVCMHDQGVYARGNDSGAHAQQCENDYVKCKL
jgi:hypothetical protein